MDFIGIGPAELLVILVLTLIVVGPHRLPEMAAQLGRFMRAFRRYSAQVTREFNETMQDLEKEYDQMKGEWKDVGQGLDDAAKSVNKEIDAAAGETRAALNEAPESSKTPSTSQQ
jgi:sec-independent protein translocase protein TatB